MYITYDFIIKVISSKSTSLPKGKQLNHSIMHMKENILDIGSSNTEIINVTDCMLSNSMTIKNVSVSDYKKFILQMVKYLVI